MVVYKDAQSINVFKFGSFSVISRFNTGHSLSATEYILNGIVHRVIEQTCDVVLICSYVCRISVEALAHLENTCSSSVLSPKVFRYFWNSIDSNTVEAVLDY